MQLKNISVIGAGTMGHGIAECFAMHGYKVSLYESYEPIRNSALRTIHDELTFMAYIHVECCICINCIKGG